MVAGEARLIQQLHNSLAMSMLYFMLVCGIWGVGSAIGRGLSPSLSGALVIGEALIVVQGALGALSYAAGSRPGQALHVLYGLAAAITLPAIYTYARGRSAKQQALFYGFGALFIFGLAIRGITTGRLV